jgi:PAS domain S-box-containing protein
VFLAVFMAPVAVGLWSLVHFDSKTASADLTARIGNQAARAALALERHAAIGKGDLTRDLLAPLTADRAVECVDVEFAYRPPLGHRIVTGLECDEHERFPHELMLPVGDGRASLAVRFTDAEIHDKARLHRRILMAGLAGAALISIVAVWLGFRSVVGVRTGRLNRALRQIAEGGSRQPVPRGSNDELGQIIASFNRMIAKEEEREETLQNTEAAVRRANDTLAMLTRESERRFRDFVASASDWYWEMDDQLRFSYFSDRFSEVTGVPKEALLGKTRRETGIPNVDADAWAAHLKALDDHVPFRNFEHPRIKSDGEEVWLSISGSPVFDDDGTFKGYRGTGRDITQRERAKQLEAEKEVSEQLARTKGEFLANMSHEIRTPINGVLGMTEILLKTELDANQRRFASTIRRSGEALLRVINDILDFSKIEAGKLTLHSAPFDLRELMEDLGELFAEGAHSKQLELVVDTPVDLACQFSGDGGRLRQVLTNLIGNAIKFTDEGEVVVRVARVEGKAGRACLRFTVTDTGIGIPVETQAQVFDSFAQADGSHQRRFGGTGLGLAISAQLVKMMDGEIGVDSAPGEGSMFWFTVWLDVDPGAAALPSSPATLAGARVLIVDDNPTNREILEHQLAAWGMRCIRAECGPQALARIQGPDAGAQPIELAVLDMDMPAMDGIELATRLREVDGLQALPTVILSSVCDGLGARQDAMSSVDAYLLKPVRQAELRRCLESLLGASAADIDAKADMIEDSTSPGFHGKVLLAEDNLVNQEVALSWLEPMGLEVSVAENGRAAVQAWQAQEFDLVFMDCQMPELSGFEAAAAIRMEERASERGHVPIVALTANALQGDRQRCLQAGMDDYLSKPYTEQQLVDALTRWLPASRPEPRRGDAGIEAAAVEAAAIDDDELLDRSVLARYRARARPDRKGVLQRILEAYLGQSGEQMRSLQQACAEVDTKAVCTLAHMLKSSSAQVGAAGLAEQFRVLEEHAATGSLQGLADRMSEVDRLHRRVCAALEHEVGRAAA